jgi:hypothetical protein
MTNLAGKEPVAIGYWQDKAIQFVRSNRYVRLNEMAEVYGKRIDHWLENKSTKEYLTAFRLDPVYRGYEPIIAVRGGNTRNSGERTETPSQSGNRTDPSNSGYRSRLIPEGVQGTWAHPDIAIEFARWCDPVFGLWCNRQIRYLLTYGEVCIHYSEWDGSKMGDALQSNRDDIKELYGKN